MTYIVVDRDKKFILYSYPDETLGSLWQEYKTGRNEELHEHCKFIVTKDEQDTIKFPERPVTTLTSDYLLPKFDGFYLNLADIDAFKLEDGVIHIRTADHSTPGEWEYTILLDKNCLEVLLAMGFYFHDVDEYLAEL